MIDDLFEDIESTINRINPGGFPNFSRIEKALLYVIKILGELHQLGLVTEGPFIIKDTKKVEQILGDFKPTKQEMREVIDWMKEKEYIAEPEE